MTPSDRSSLAELSAVCLSRCNLNGTSQWPCCFHKRVAVRDFLYQGHLLVRTNTCEIRCTGKRDPCRYMECYPFGHQGRQLRRPSSLTYMHAWQPFQNLKV
ncbi:Os07g0682850 [Oryza sativa Japonica Group]|uniref:Os07g0682850 protein n=1 Tax=Oryza sativa subsp. japonica TaxID=39947 RepID=A0A0P0XA90_ORYSJ|nr:hypothetical protein EE612_041435 [Oryza sativa]BAT03261.1 Os07g0682850 [Oryza sativa Japonica Group]